MTYKYKYLVGEIGEKADALYAEYPDVMEAVTKEAIRAWKTGFRRGFVKSGAIITVSGVALGAAAAVIHNKIKNRKKKSTFSEFDDYDI